MLLKSIEIAATGLTAQRLRLDVIANNIANVNTTRGPFGSPYRRQQVVFAPRGGYLPFIVPGMYQEIPKDALPSGVRVLQIREDPAPLRMVYEPGHPDANEEGYVAYPNVNVVTEMTDMISTTRAYEANVSIISAAKSMAMKALEIGKG